MSNYVFDKSLIPTGYGSDNIGLSKLLEDVMAHMGRKGSIVTNDNILDVAYLANDYLRREKIAGNPDPIFRVGIKKEQLNDICGTLSRCLKMDTNGVSQKLSRDYVNDVYSVIEDIYCHEIDGVSMCLDLITTMNPTTEEENCIISLAVGCILTVKKVTGPRQKL